MEYSVPSAVRRGLFSIGRDAVDRGNITLASNVANVLYDVCPHAPQGMEIDGLIHDRKGLKDAAVTTFSACLSKFPKSETSFRFLAKSYLDDGDLEMVVNLVYDFENISTAHSSIIVPTADQLAGKNELRKASGILLKLIEAGSDDIDVYIRASQMMRSLGDLNENRRLLNRLLELHPYNPYSHLADVHDQLAERKFLTARDTLEHLSQQFPRSGLLLSMLCENDLELKDSARLRERIPQLEGLVSGSRIEELKVRLAALDRDWNEVIKILDHTKWADLGIRRRILRTYAHIFSGDYEQALEICANSVKDPSVRRWYDVAEQVAYFKKRQGVLPNDSSYSYIAQASKSNEHSERTVPPVIRMLWVGGKLSPVEQLSAKSWLDNGFRVEMWSYDDLGNVPTGCVVRDGNEIIPRDQIFTHSEKTGRSKGSFAGFADIFRWKLLEKKGGFWADCDIICLKQFDLPDELVIASEVARTFHVDHPAITNCFYGGPKGHDFFVKGANHCESVDPEALAWGEVGTTLIGRLVLEGELERNVLPNTAFNAVGPYDMLPFILGKDTEAARKAISRSWGIHLYNEVWRTNNLSKWGPFPKDSVLHNLFKKHGIDVEVSD